MARAGDIEGTVKFPGEALPPTLIANGLTSECPRGIPTDHLKVDPVTRGLKNTLVVLDWKGDQPDVKSKPLGLKSEGCRLLPRLQWTMLPAYLTMTNLDDNTEDLEDRADDTLMFHVDLVRKGTSVRRPVARLKK